jgi:hypothetical protein
MASVKTRIGNMDFSSDIRSSLKTLPFRVIDFVQIAHYHLVMLTFGHSQKTESGRNGKHQNR